MGEMNNKISNGCDGSSYEKAIVVESVDAEYEWLHTNYPGYIMQMQMLGQDKGKSYDIISIQMINGITKEIYFDISRFFGYY